MPPKKHTVFLVDDHPIVRQGLALLIDQEPDLHICGTAADARSALTALTQAKPDIVVTDLSMPGPDGLELIKNLRALLPKTPVLVLSMHDEALYTERALKAGARGYIMKHETETDIISAIRRVLKGEIYLSPEMTGHFLSKLNKTSMKLPESPINVLGDREFQIFRLLGHGRRTSEIAAELGIGIKTVETHLRRIREKLNHRNRNELAREAAVWVQQQEE